MEEFEVVQETTQEENLNLDVTQTEEPSVITEYIGYDYTETLTETNSLLAQSNELLLHVYASQLFFIGVCGASVVLFTLYKFLRKFF